MDQLGRHDAKTGSRERAVLRLDDYVHERERRRRARSMRSALILVWVSAVIAVVYRSLLAIGVIAVALVLVVLVGRLVLAIGDRRARNAQGPRSRSVPARLPVRYGRRHLPMAPWRGSEEVELPGRLVLHTGEWTWTPSRGQAAKGIPAVAFGGGWTSTTRRIWGPWNQGLLTLTRRDGERVDLWVRNQGHLVKGQDAEPVEGSTFDSAT